MLPTLQKLGVCTLYTTSWTQCPVPRIQHSHACSYYNYYCSYIVIHDYHKIILHAVESRSVNVPLIVAATVPSVVVVILVSVIIVTFTIIVYKQLQKHSTNEGNNLYDVTNLSDVPSVPPGLSPSNAKFEITVYTNASLIICQPEVEQNGCQTHCTVDYTESNSHEEVFNDVKAICTL